MTATGMPMKSMPAIGIRHYVVPPPHVIYAPPPVYYPPPPPSPGINLILPLHFN